MKIEGGLLGGRKGLVGGKEEIRWKRELIKICVKML